MTDAASSPASPAEPASESGRERDSRLRSGWFVTTQWTVVLTAGRNDTPRAKDALASLCQTYWYPIYAHVRRRGLSPQDAEDLTQAFFEKLLEANTLARITRDRGKFRSFLLTSVDHFLVDEWKRARTQKRGAGRIASLDAHLAEERFGAELADPRGADCVFGFDRDYALALLNTVMSRLEAEYQAQGRSRTFAILKPCLASDRAGLHHVDLAASLGVPVNTAKVLVHRMRRRCRELLREEVANTVSEPGEVDEELRHLLKVLAA